MVGVVELLEDSGLLPEVLGAREALRAEEAFVEDVVEVLDDAVAPRLGEGDEAHPHAQAESEADRKTAMTALALEGLAVVDLDPSGDPQPAPDAHQTPGDLPLTFGDG
jgi:hypothetical protein